MLRACTLTCELVISYFLKKEKRSASRAIGLAGSRWTGHAGVTGTSGTTCRNQRPLIGSQAFNTSSSVILGPAPIFKLLRCSPFGFCFEADLRPAWWVSAKRPRNPNQQLVYGLHGFR